MRIAMVALHFSEYASNLAQALESMGHEVLMLAQADNLAAELSADSAAVLPAKHEIMTYRRLRDPWVIANLVRLVRRVKCFAPDVIHVQESRQDYLLGAAPFLKRIAPLIVTVHDPAPHSGIGDQLARHRQAGIQLLRKFADGLIVHGQAVRRDLETIFPAGAAKIVAIPHGVLGRAPAEDAQPWVPGRILFFGRIERYKGLGMLIAAADILAGSGIPVSMVIAGRGPDLDNHRPAIAAHPNCELRERHIDRSEIPGLFQSANVVALPYLDGTQSGVAALAARYGRPVVASAVGSIPEMVLDGETGLIVPPGDPSVLAAALEKIIADQSLAQRLGANATRRAEGELSWRTIAGRTLEFYGAVVGTPPAPAARSLMQA